MCNSTLVNFGARLIALIGYGSAMLMLAFACLVVLATTMKAVGKEAIRDDLIAITLLLAGAFVSAAFTAVLLKSIG